MYIIIMEIIYKARDKRFILLDKHITRSLNQREYEN
jgi:hypothetical protein